MRRLCSVLIPVCMLLGCYHAQKRSTTQPSGDFRLGRREIAIPASDTVIWSGTLPFLQLFAPGGPLQLTDLSDHIVLWSGQTPPNSLIRVDAAGVTIGSEHIYPRTLRTDHQYELILKSTPSSVNSQIVVPSRKNLNN